MRCLRERDTSVLSSAGKLCSLHQVEVEGETAVQAKVSDADYETRITVKRPGSLEGGHAGGFGCLTEPGTRILLNLTSPNFTTRITISEYESSDNLADVESTCPFYRASMRSSSLPSSSSIARHVLRTYHHIGVPLLFPNCAIIVTPHNARN